MSFSDNGNKLLDAIKTGKWLSSNCLKYYLLGYNAM
jgi:hypothetical protein